MSYTAIEQSSSSGHPLYLFRFSLGESLWLYTSADHKVVKEEEEYIPVYIKGGKITRTGDIKKNNIDIEMASTNPVALCFLPGWTGGIMSITVYRHHYEDNEFSVQWKGRVVSCKWSGSSARLNCESTFTIFQRAGLRRVYQPGCPHVLYGPGCNVNSASYRVAGTVAAASGKTVTITGLSGYSAGWFAGGIVKFGNDRRLIIWNSGNNLSVLDAIPNLIVGSAVELWPGCARDMGTCLSKFNNLDNFGGLPFLPNRNPFSGDAIV